VRLADAENRRLEMANAACSDTLMTTKVSGNKSENKVLELRSAVTLAKGSLVTHKNAIQSAIVGAEELFAAVVQSKAKYLEGKQKLAAAFKNCEDRDKEQQMVVMQTEEALHCSINGLRAQELKLEQTKDACKSETYAYHKTIKDTELSNLIDQEQLQEKTDLCSEFRSAIAERKNRIKQMQDDIGTNRKESRDARTEFEIAENSLRLKLKGAMDLHAQQMKDLAAVAAARRQMPLVQVEAERNQIMQEFEQARMEAGKLKADVETRMTLLDETAASGNQLSQEAVQNEVKIEELMSDATRIGDTLDDGQSNQAFQTMVLRDGIKTKLELFKILRIEQQKYRDRRQALVEMSETHKFKVQQMRELRVRLESELIDRDNAVLIQKAVLDAQVSYNNDIEVSLDARKAEDRVSATDMELKLVEKREEVSEMYAVTLDEDLRVAKLGLKRRTQNEDRHHIEHETKMVHMKEGDRDIRVKQNRYEAQLITGQIEARENVIEGLRRKMLIREDEVRLLASQEATYTETFHGLKQQMADEKARQRILARASAEKNRISEALLAAVEKQKMETGKLGFHESIVEMKEKAHTMYGDLSSPQSSPRKRTW